MSSSNTSWTTESNTKSGSVQVYSSDVSVLKVVGGEGGDAIIDLFADQGDDNADKWRLWVNAGDDDLHFSNYTSGTAWTDILTLQDGGNVGIGNDSPGGKLEVKQTSAAIGLFINQDGNHQAISIDSESTTQHIIDIASPAITSGDVLRIVSADALTGGRLALFHSESSTTDTRSLVKIVNDHVNASGATCLEITQDASQNALTINHNGASNAISINHDGNASAINIDSESTSANVLTIPSATTTTGNIINVDNANSLTTGALAYFHSDSASTSTRHLVHIINDSASADNTDSGLLLLDQDANSRSILINSAATTTQVVSIESPATTSSRILHIGNADALTTGTMAYFHSNSSDTSTRNLVEIKNDHSSSSGTTCLFISQDANERALCIDQNGNNNSIQIDSESTTSDIINVSNAETTTGNILKIYDANALTTGRLVYLHSNSSTTDTRSLGTMHNKHASATGATVLTLVQDAAQRALFIDQNGNHTALSIDSESTSADTFNINDPENTSGKVFSITNADALTTGSLGYFHSNSAQTNSRQLVHIINDNPLASNAAGLSIQQDAIATGIGIAHNNPVTTGSTYAINVDVNKTGVTADSAQATVHGMLIDVDDTASNHAGSTTVLTGLKVDITGNANGSSTNYGVYSVVASADANYPGVFMGGDVGIGVTTPSQELHVAGSNTTATALWTNCGSGNIPGIKVQNTDTTDGNYAGYFFANDETVTAGIVVEMETHSSDDSSMTFATSVGGATRTKMILDKDGKLGIGTTTPAEFLDVAANIRMGNKSTDGTGIASYFTMERDGSVVGGLSTYAGVFNLFAGTTTTAQHLTIRAAGTVGIGTGNPNNILQINHAASDGDDGILIVNENTTVASGAWLGAIGFDSADGNIPSSAVEASAFIGAKSSEAHSTGDKGGDLIFGTSAVDDDDDTASHERMRINSEGNVGIGVNDPVKKLQVDGAIIVKNNYGYVQQDAAGNSATLMNQNGSDLLTIGDVTHTEDIYIATAGGVGIGTNSPNDNFHLKDTASDAGMIIETSYASGNAKLRLQTPNDRIGEILFEDGTASGKIRYDHSTNQMLFETSATQRMAIDANSRISLSNNDGGTDNTVFGNLAGDDLAGGGDDNVFVGHSAGHANQHGGRNIVIGYASMYNSYTNDTTDAENDDNVFIGANSGGGAWAADAASTDWSNADNIGIGSNSLAGALKGANNNIAIGTNTLNANTTGDANVVIGGDAGKVLTTATNNVAIGYNALLTHVLGGGNIAIGQGTMSNTDAGSTVHASTNNIIIGNGAGSGAWTNEDNSNCVIIGANACVGAMEGDDTDGTVAIGWSAGKNITSASGSTFVGKNAGGGSTGTTLTGNHNTGIGWSVGDVMHSTAHSNTMVGSSAGVLLTTGTQNTFLGKDAGAAITTESDCVLIGYDAGQSITETSSNGTVAIGASAGSNLTDGAGATMIGKSAGLHETIGDNNTTLGYGTMGNSGDASSGNAGMQNDDNTFIGHNAGSGNWTTNASSRNTSVGASTLAGALNGALNNTALGHASLNALIEGDDNTGVGKSAGSDIEDGIGNTCIGKNSGDTIVDGNYNTYIGNNADASGSGVASEIVIAATNSVLQGGGTENIRIGVSSDYITNNFGSNATWTHSSDIRIKKDIEDNELGLAFINDLRTVTFKKKAPSEYPQEFEQYDASKTERTKPNKVHYGFIAQEVKEAMDKAGHSEFTVWKENKDGMQELGEADFITPLIKAVQELTAKVEALENENKKRSL